MSRRFRAVSTSARHGGAYLVGVAALHVGAVSLLAVTVGPHPELIAMGLLAYTLGLRHAFDPDHIAAIDNSVRKFSQAAAKTPPHGTGFWFSLGHSTVVFLLAFALAFGGAWVAAGIPQWKDWGGLIGPTVSGLFLVVIGVVNLALWLDVLGVFRRLRKGSEVADDEIASPSGFFVRFLKPLFRTVTRSWHLYPLGFLFGLGFDTASEVALLALSTQGATQALPWTGILSLPLLFASGMCLMDTADGLFMTKAYRWAFVTPLRKVFYNLSVTGMSVLVALVIGTVELIQVAGPELGLTGGVFAWIQDIDFGNLGYIVVGLFVAAWAVSFGAWKLLKLDTVQ
jgi:high-affinity nickel-transport protein